MEIPRPTCPTQEILTSGKSEFFLLTLGTVLQPENVMSFHVYFNVRTLIMIYQIMTDFILMSLLLTYNYIIKIVNTNYNGQYF